MPGITIGQFGEPRDRSLPGGAQLTGGDELIVCEQPDRLELPESPRPAGHRAQQGFCFQIVDQAENRTGPVHGSRRIEAEPAGKHRQPAEHRLFVVAKQFVAPRNGRLQVAVPRVTGITGVHQKAQPVVEAVQDLGRG